MAKFSKNDDEFLVVFLGRRKNSEDAGFANVFFGLLAMAIVMMVFVGLMNDLEEQSRMINLKQQPEYSLRDTI
jgi:hypothetical protein